MMGQARQSVGWLAVLLGAKLALCVCVLGCNCMVKTALGGPSNPCSQQQNRSEHQQAHMSVSAGKAPLRDQRSGRLPLRRWSEKAKCFSVLHPEQVGKGWSGGQAVCDKGRAAGYCVAWCLHAARHCTRCVALPLSIQNDCWQHGPRLQGGQLTACPPTLGQVIHWHACHIAVE
jgi:hypothetical protein